jgi:hypothetical protein
LPVCCCVPGPPMGQFFLQKFTVALRRLVFLNAGHRWWGARMGLSSPLIRASWSYNAARGRVPPRLVPLMCVFPPRKG